MSKPKYPTTLFKGGADREDTIVVADESEKAAAADNGYFSFGEGQALTGGSADLSLDGEETTAGDGTSAESGDANQDKAE